MPNLLLRSGRVPVLNGRCAQFNCRRKSKSISNEFCLLEVVTLSLLDDLWSFNDQINLFLVHYLWDQLPCDLNTGSGLIPRL